MTRITAWVVLALLLIMAGDISAQLYQGPAQGSIPSGVLVNTNNFSAAPNMATPRPDVIRNPYRHQEEPIYLDLSQIDMKAYLSVDRGAEGFAFDTVNSLLLRNYQGLTQTNSIPPDPHIAVGPTHIMAVVNSDFGIYDRAGNLIKRINADSWYGSTVSNPGAFDPKVVYDHFAKRWVMVWLDQSNTIPRGLHLISVSDDSIPTGAWYNYSFPTNQNGSTVVSNWMDYQGVGFDEEALYVVGNQFGFTGGFNYAKIRIYNKAELYANTGGAVTWNDLWQIKYPGLPNNVFHIRPMIKWTPGGGKYYFMNVPSSGGNFACVWTLTDPITNPVLTGNNIFVTSYSNPPNANQLGGGTPLVSVNGAQLQCEPVFRDGFLYAVHAIANPQSFANSALHYIKINTGNMSLAEEVVYGAPGYWYFFGAIGVDKHHNVALTFSRSAETEYVGAFYSVKKDGSLKFDNSKPLQEGRANYVKTFGGDRNRWGDYMGMWTDPVNEENFLMLTEFVSAQHTWNTWIGELRVAPYPGSYVQTSVSSLNYGTVKLEMAKSLPVEVISFGEQDVVVDTMYTKTQNFSYSNIISYPFTIPSNRSLVVDVNYAPVDTGTTKDTLYIKSGSATYKVALQGYGYVINPASQNTMYAVAGPGGSGRLFNVNPATAATTPVGFTNYTSIISQAIHPKTGVIYALKNNPAELLWINATRGDGYQLLPVDLSDASSIAFDTSGTLYLATRSARIFTVGLPGGNLTEICTTRYNVQSIAFHPQTNELYAAVYKALGAGRDLIMKISLPTGDTTHVGLAGVNTIINDIEFSNTGVLYGVKGTANAANDLFSISLANGAATIIGSMGVSNVTALGHSINGTTGIDDNNQEIPQVFSLKQNYPNPFNPTTTIEFTLPFRAEVSVKIYNVLGQQVRELFSGMKESGVYKLNWNADDSAGGKLPSGVYFYELTAKGMDNNQTLSDIRKMVLLK